MNPSEAVLDSFALLAFLRGETGEKKVADLLEKAAESEGSLHMTEVNFAEVKYITLRKDGPELWAQVARELPALPIEFHPATRSLADTAADFKARWKLSLADAFAAALAKEKGIPLVTGDPEFKALAKEIKVVWIG
jgi:ribonuclease VapC